MTMTREWRRITLQLSQIGLTLGLTCIAFLLPGRSLVAVDDAAPVEVIGAQLDDHPVLGKDADVVLANLSGDVREHHVPVVELDAEARVRERLRDRALDLDHSVLLRHASPNSRLRRCRGRVPRTWFLVAQALLTVRRVTAR